MFKVMGGGLGVSAMLNVMTRGVRGVSHVQGDGRGLRGVSHVQGDGRVVRGVSHVQGDGRG